MDMAGGFLGLTNCSMVINPPTKYIVSAYNVFADTPLYVLGKSWLGRF